MELLVLVLKPQTRYLQVSRLRLCDHITYQIEVPQLFNATLNSDPFFSPFIQSFFSFVKRMEHSNSVFAIFAKTVFPPL